jgi:hypothetical protein
VIAWGVPITKENVTSMPPARIHVIACEGCLSDIDVIAGRYRSRDVVSGDIRRGAALSA